MSSSAASCGPISLPANRTTRPSATGVIVLEGEEVIGFQRATIPMSRRSTTILPLPISPAPTIFSAGIDRPCRTPNPITAGCAGARSGGKVQLHHLVPKAKKGRMTVPVHPICHRAIHANFTNAQLARIGTDRDALLTDETLAPVRGMGGRQAARFPRPDAQAALINPPVAAEDRPSAAPGSWRAVRCRRRPNGRRSCPRSSNTPAPVP